MIPARRLFVLLGLVALLIVAGSVSRTAWTLAVAGNLAVLVAAMVDFLRARARRLAVSRRWPALIAQGEGSRLELDFWPIAANGRAKVSGRWEIQIREGLHPALAERSFRRRFMLGREGARLSVALRPTRRGDHATGPLDCRVLGPWGLVWAQRRLLDGDAVRVYPRVRWGGRVGQLLSLAQRNELGAVTVDRQGVGGELYALRSYLPGDPPNRIHWKASARFGEMVTREDTWERGAPVILVFDCARAMATQSGRLSKLDHSLAAGLALSRVCASRGDRLGIVAFSNRILKRLQMRPSKSGIAQAYEQLYGLQAELVEPVWDVVTDAILSLGIPRATVVLFTSVVDLAVADLLREALLRLRRRHRPLLINLEDPVVRALAEGVPTGPAEAYAKLASLEIILRNRQLARQLRRSGIASVSASADALALETLEAYFALLSGGGRRSRGRHAAAIA